MNDTKNLALELCEKISRANDKFRKVQAKQMLKQKLTSPQFGVLEILYKTGPLSLKKISDEMMVTGANITCVADNLEKEGYLIRIHSKTDRRVILAELTESGRNKIESIYLNITKIFLQWFHHSLKVNRTNLSTCLINFNKNKYSDEL